jgi:hypothetical protein
VRENPLDQLRLLDARNDFKGAIRQKTGGSVATRYAPSSTSKPEPELKLLLQQLKLTLPEQPPPRITAAN